ncbi:MAG: hypothetical protein AAF160_15035 [Pseudomonadota bacterium]
MKLPSSANASCLAAWLFLAVPPAAAPGEPQWSGSSIEAMSTLCLTPSLELDAVREQAHEMGLNVATSADARLADVLSAVDTVDEAVLFNRIGAGPLLGGLAWEAHYGLDRVMRECRVVGETDAGSEPTVAEVLSYLTDAYAAHAENVDVSHDRRYLERGRLLATGDEGRSDLEIAYIREGSAYRWYLEAGCGPCGEVER